MVSHRKDKSRSAFNLERLNFRSPTYSSEDVRPIGRLPAESKTLADIQYLLYERGFTLLTPFLSYASGHFLRQTGVTSSKVLLNRLAYDYGSGDNNIFFSGLTCQLGDKEQPALTYKQDQDHDNQEPHILLSAVLPDAEGSIRNQRRLIKDLCRGPARLTPEQQAMDEERLNTLATLPLGILPGTPENIIVTENTIEDAIGQCLLPEVIQLGPLKELKEAQRFF